MKNDNQIYTEQKKTSAVSVSLSSLTDLQYMSLIGLSAFKGDACVSVKKYSLDELSIFKCKWYVQYKTH